MVSDVMPAEDQLREWFVQAMAFHKAMLLDEAAALYENILAIVPEDPPALHLLGVLRHTQGKFDAAVRHLRGATAARPDNASLHAALGAALRGAERTEEALVEYDRAIALKPDFAEAHNHRAVALQRLDRLDAAIEGYRAAIAAQPDYADAYNNLGTALRQADRREEALEAYRMALAHRPTYVDALGNLAKLEIELGNNLAAVEAYRRLLDQRPDDFDALSATGNLLVVLDREEEAVGYYAAALELRPRDPVLLDRLSVALLFLDRVQEAVGLLGEAIGIDRTLAPAWLHSGIALEKLGMVDEARKALETAIELDPNLPLARFTLGMLLLAMGEPEAARPVFVEWHRLAPDHPIARHMVAAVSGTDVPDRASADYVAETFNTFSKTFDHQLAQLGYQAPQLLGDLLRAHGSPANGSLAVADLGCGTGLCAGFLKPLARELVGVDLASGMLERARQRGLYDELVLADITDFLAANPGRFDLIVATDTFIYFGDLAPILDRAFTALRPGGRLAFTLEEAIGETVPPSYVLTTSGRYQHEASSVHDLLAEAGFQLVGLSRGVLRNEAKQPVPGLVVLVEAVSRDV
jgi:predicted TPR repeat methyltransferase